MIMNDVGGQRYWWCFYYGRAFWGSCCGTLFGALFDRWSWEAWRNSMDQALTVPIVNVKPALASYYKMMSEQVLDN